MKKPKHVEKLVKFLDSCNLSNYDYPRYILVIFVKTNGKYACDGIVGTVKHLAAGLNLQKNSNVVSQKFV